MLKLFYFFLLLAAVLYLGACGYLYFNQRALIFLPTPPAQVGNASELRVQSEGETLRIWQIGPAGGNAVIFFGGNAQDVAAFIPLLSQALPDRAVYLVNYRGYGGSSGTPSEAAFFKDALTVYDLVRRTHAKVAVIGQSLGSGVAMYLASQRDLDKLVLLTPYDSVENVAKKNFPLFPVSLLLKHKFDSAGRAPAIKVPALVILAQHDELIPRANSEALIAAFRLVPPKVKVVPGTTHNSVCGTDDCLHELREFIGG